MLYLRDLQGQAGTDSPDALTPHAIACERPLLIQQYQPHVRMEGGKQVQNSGAHRVLHEEAALDPGLQRLGLPSQHSQCYLSLFSCEQPSLPSEHYSFARVLRRRSVSE